MARLPRWGDANRLPSGNLDLTRRPSAPVPAAGPVTSPRGGGASHVRAAHLLRGAAPGCRRPGARASWAQESAANRGRAVGDDSGSGHGAEIEAGIRADDLPRLWAV